MDRNSGFSELDEEFFRRGEELASETPEDFSDLDEAVEPAQEAKGAGRRAVIALRRRALHARANLVTALSRD